MNHLPTFHSITAERAFLFALGGGCKAPIAALGTVNGKTLHVDGLISNVSGTKIMRDSEQGRVDEAKEIGERLAQKLLDAGAEKFLSEVEDYDTNR